MNCVTQCCFINQGLVFIHKTSARCIKDGRSLLDLLKRPTDRSFACYNPARLMKIPTLCLLALLLTCTGLAQPSATPPALQKTFIHAGHMLDVKIGKMLDNVTVSIEGDKVTGVSAGQNSPAESQAGARVINLPNATLLPGLIDAHTHLTFDPNFGYQELGVSIPKEALIGAKNARITLEAGFTTVRNVGAKGYADIALRDAINE